jgi:hypothetical protein
MTKYSGPFLVAVLAIGPFVAYAFAEDRCCHTINPWPECSGCVKIAEGV